MHARRPLEKNDTLSAQQKIIKQLIESNPYSQDILRSECTHPFICIYVPGERIEYRISAYNLPWMEYRICPFCGDCEAVTRDPNIVQRTNDEMIRRRFAIRDHAPVRKIDEQVFFEILSSWRTSQRKGLGGQKERNEGTSLRSAIDQYKRTLSEFQCTCTHDNIYALKQDDLLHNIGISTSQILVCSSCGLEEVLKGSPSRTRRIIEKTLSTLSKKKPEREISEEELHRIRAHFSPIPCRI